MEVLNNQTLEAKDHEAHSKAREEQQVERQEARKEDRAAEPQAADENLVVLGE